MSPTPHPQLQSIHLGILPFCDRLTQFLMQMCLFCHLNHSFLVWPDGQGCRTGCWTVGHDSRRVSSRSGEMLSLSAHHLTPRGMSCSPSIVLDGGRAKARMVAVSPGEGWIPHNAELSGHLQSCSELSRPAAACGAVCLKSLFLLHFPGPFGKSSYDSWGRYCHSQPLSWISV